MIHVWYNGWTRIWTEDIADKDLNLHNDHASSGAPNLLYNG